MRGQTTAPSAENARDLAAAAEFTGRRVESVRVVGNTQVSTIQILNAVRTREGDKFDPATVVEDYQRIFGLKQFADVEARIEPTATGVIVTYVVTEQKQIHAIRYKGNVNIQTQDLEGVVDLRPKEALDRFRINLARTAIEKLYHEKNFPFAHVTVSAEDMAKTGDVVFTVVEGPQVKIRKVDFIGNNSFSDWRLNGQVKTAYWIPIFRAGTYDPEQVEEDVAALQRFYQDRGYFDVRVGRKLTFSPDLSELQVTFVIDEGVPYRVEHVEFKGNRTVSEADLRKNMKLLEGQQYDSDVLDRDVRTVVKAYSPYGFIYDQQPLSPNPDYLQINHKEIFKRAPGKIDLVYEIHEGRPFRLGRILVKGNENSQDKLVLREMHVAPGQLYNSAELQDAQDRLRGTPFYSSVVMTPIGEDPNVRDLLVEVTEQRTASISVGAGINSNGGVGANLSYEQKNFDIGNPPATFSDLFSDRAFTGAGQDFQASFDPGTQETNATLSFTEPYLFDQPYSFGTTGYLRDRIREDYTDQRLGGRISFGHRFNYEDSVNVFFRGEDVKIKSINDENVRAAEIDAGKGHHTVTSVGFELRHDTTNHGPLPYRGTDTIFGVEQIGALGGTVDFTRITSSFNAYQTISEDLLDRRTIVNEHVEAGYIPQSPRVDKRTPSGAIITDNPRGAPFYERFYGGGLGSIRGFEFRGVSPREGPENDRIGGNFSLTGGVELGFPIAADVLRGVVFTDVGDVERDFHLGTIRSSVGAGVRLVLPFFGQVPLALDFAVPITRNHQDDTQFISFSLGVSR